MVCCNVSPAGVAVDCTSAPPTKITACVEVASWAFSRLSARRDWIGERLLHVQVFDRGLLEVSVYGGFFQYVLTSLDLAVVRDSLEEWFLSLDDDPVDSASPADDGKD